MEFCDDLGENADEFSTTSIVIGAAVVALIAGVVVFAWVWYRRQPGRRGARLQHIGLGEDSTEAPDHPMLNGNSLRHMIEMTTSGSGSGNILGFFFIKSHIF